MRRAMPLIYLGREETRRETSWRIDYLGDVFRRADLEQGDCRRLAEAARRVDCGH
jgi:hypothetical protein